MMLKRSAWSIKRDKWTHMLLCNCFAFLKERSRANISSQFPTLAHGQIARMRLANNSKIHRAQGIFPLPSFCPTYYGLSNVMRQKGTRHAFIECRVTARECNARGRGWGQRRRGGCCWAIIIVNALLYGTRLTPGRGDGGRRRRAAVIVAIRHADDGAKLTVSVVLCIPFRIGNVI